MALTTTPHSPSTAPVSLSRPPLRRRARVLAVLVIAALVDALHPAEADFRIRHVAVISASLVVLAAAAVAGVFHR